jgi:hypothetical protein
VQNTLQTLCKDACERDLQMDEQKGGVKVIFENKP